MVQRITPQQKAALLAIVSRTRWRDRGIQLVSGPGGQTVVQWGECSASERAQVEDLFRDWCEHHPHEAIEGITMPSCRDDGDE